MHEPIPPDFPVQPLKPGQKAEDKVTCGHCGLSWDDAISTDWTPAPSARCPFECFHIYPDNKGEKPMPREVNDDLVRQRKEFIAPLLEKVLKGDSVKIGVFDVREDYVYKREKDDKGHPLFDRVVSLVYFDEDEDDNPSTEDFDGTLDSFYRCLDAHDAFEMFDNGEEGFDDDN